MKIENRLGPSDFSALADAFRDGEADIIELLPTLDLGFVKILPLTVSRSDSSYVISTSIFLQIQSATRSLSIRILRSAAFGKGLRR
jgi:hypothetical protein